MKKLTTILLILLTTLFISCEETPAEDPYDVLMAAKVSLTIPAEVTEDTLLPESINTASIETNDLLYTVDIIWTSNIEGTLVDNKFVPSIIDQDITLTAVLTFEGKTIISIYNTTLKGKVEDNNGTENEDEQTVSAVANSITFDNTDLTEDIVLPVLQDGVTITWETSNSSYLSNTGSVLRPSENEGDQSVTLTATFTLNEVTVNKTYTFTILATTQTVTYEGYYVGADGLTGDALKAFLHELIDDHTVLTYSQLWDALSDSDEDPNDSGSVILLYSGVSYDEDNHGGNSSEWNREHVWPRSHGDLTSTVANSDMHHIRPTKVPVNSSRGNLDFDEGGSLVSGTTDSYKDGDSFEPRDEVKGDVARMMFYMAVRYEGGSGEPDLELVDYVSTSGPNLGKLSVLIEWHLNDLPDEFEIRRNEIIFSYQGNRNPFIDHPEFVQMIWS